MPRTGDDVFQSPMGSVNVSIHSLGLRCGGEYGQPLLIPLALFEVTSTPHYPNLDEDGTVSNSLGYAKRDIN